MPKHKIIHFYRTPAISSYKKESLLKNIKQSIAPCISDIESEFCFNIEVSKPLATQGLNIIKWLLQGTFESGNLSNKSFLKDSHQFSNIIEVGPGMNFTTTWSTNAVSICQCCGLTNISRIERSRRYNLISSKKISQREIEKISTLLYDRMTECRYNKPLKTFQLTIKPEPVFYIPLFKKGKIALIELNKKMGLGFDDRDIEYYYNFFVKELKRNPTNVECFDLSQSNSEHSRHWFFKGNLLIDNKEVKETLMQIIKTPYFKNPNNSIIAFKDNSSAIKGYKIKTLLPSEPDKPSLFQKKEVIYHLIFTAETHNFPTGVAPFPGAETGTGGRIRDVHATGRGGLVVAGTAGYCVGNLQIPNYNLPWEDKKFIYPQNLATPLRIEIEASNGASDYGNKFGEPIIQGFTRSFGLLTSDNERREWIKPIMFSGGIGQIDDRHQEKKETQKGMLIIKIGGPAYRIGIGGGSASSMIQGQNREELDFNAVQRGDAEMEQKSNRVIRACIEMGEDNPILSIHDQGAGGNCNVVKEIIYPSGAKIDIRKILVGDNTLSVLEIWGAEYQEQDALLIYPDKLKIFKQLCQREKAPFSVIGKITGDGFIVIYDKSSAKKEISTPVNLNLKKILGEMPQKTFPLIRLPIKTTPFFLPKDITIKKALKRVLRLLSVGSKRFLTTKVDRSVTGLIARQQCVGPFHLPVSDVSVIAQSHFGLTGSAISIGEQPIKGLISPSAMARMSVGEALTNIMWAKITKLEDIKCSANWMWAPKLEGEGARLYESALSTRDMMIDLGIAIDGGKDSLSMASFIKHKNNKSEIVKSPGTLVISMYAPCPDITKIITPDIKHSGRSKLIYIDLGKGKDRMGGSALAQCYKQIGDESPDMEDNVFLKNTFKSVQYLIDKGLITAGHDRSDGGLITTVLEMAFSGGCGMDINLSIKNEATLPFLFSEELGLVIEYLPINEAKIVSVFNKFSIPCQVIGQTKLDNRFKITVNSNNIAIDEDIRDLRATWEETGFKLDMLQANPKCVLEERQVTYSMPKPPYYVSFKPLDTPSLILINRKIKPSVAIIREEGSNGDREMTSAFYLAGFDVWDISMSDLINKNITLERFKGAVYVGGFSYGDVLGSAKGWAGGVIFNPILDKQFQKFYSKQDTFSLGVCNGCQLMTLLGWLPYQGIKNNLQPRFIQNKSCRFESRFSTVKILPSPSLMLQGMEDSILGVWVAHGEGQAYFPDKTILNEIENNNLAPIRYIDHYGKITEKYPLNPNGSPLGIAAICSEDGRHLAMMPHPERVFLKWQWPWLPKDLMINLKASPWLRMFQNARIWIEGK